MCKLLGRPFEATRRGLACEKWTTEPGTAKEVGTLNVESMTGRGRELADWMERRRAEVMCVHKLGGKEIQRESLVEGSN